MMTSYYYSNKIDVVVMKYTNNFFVNPLNPLFYNVLKSD